MAQARVLLVESDVVRAQQMTLAIQVRLFVRPSRVASGEAALNWLAEYPCDACLLAYRLPGMDGLETLVHIRQRWSRLPVVMLSTAGTEQAAVAAFRAGAADYLPVGPGFAEAAARRVDEIIRNLPATRPEVAPVAADVPPQLLEPTYQNRLRTIGRQIDRHGYRSSTLLEVVGGFLAVAIPAGLRTPEALEFADRDFPFLVATAIGTRSPRPPVPKLAAHELLPTGYEDFLRALGWRLDTTQSEAVMVSELEDRIVVAGRRHGAGATSGGYRRFHDFLGPTDIAALLDEAFRHRGPGPSRSGRGRH